LPKEEVWWIAFLAFSAAVAACDLRMRRVPNRLLVWAAAGQLAWLFAFSRGGAAPAGAQGGMDALGGFLLGLAFLPLWNRRVMGAGDVKYLAVLGLAVGVVPWLWVLLLGTLASGACALALLWLRWRRPGSPLRGVPYAGCLALAAASLALMPSSSPWCSWCSSSWSTAF